MRALGGPAGGRALCWRRGPRHRPARVPASGRGVWASGRPRPQPEEGEAAVSVATTSASPVSSGLSGRQRGSEFAELSRLINAAGLLERRRGYYAWRIAANVGLFVLGATVFVVVGDSWWQLLTGVYFAVVFAQFAFVGHDAGHRQIFASRRRNDLVGYVHSAVTGISYRWWVGKHNRHHANPNHEGKDPDVAIPVLAFSQRQSFTKRGFSKWVTKYQAFLFFPLLLLEAVVLRVASIEAVLRREVKF